MNHLRVMSLLEEVWMEENPQTIQSAWYKAKFDHEWIREDKIEGEEVPATFSYDPYHTDENAEYEAWVLREVERFRREIMEEAELALAQANKMLQRESIERRLLRYFFRCRFKKTLNVTPKKIRVVNKNGNRKVLAFLSVKKSIVLAMDPQIELNRWIHCAN